MNNWQMWVVVVLLLLLMLCVAWLFDKWLAERHRSKQLAIALHDIGELTGFYNVAIADPRHFKEYLERYGFENPNDPSTGPEFKLYDSDLDRVVNGAVDMSKGRCNMDGGLLFMKDLDILLDRLNPQHAPHHYGHPADPKDQ